METILRDYQWSAVRRMKNGCILNGGVGSGKSRTSLMYYFMQQGGSFDGGHYHRMKNPKDLYIITTARKRDTKEWELELPLFGMTTNQKLSMYDHVIEIDSWNKIAAYKMVHGAFFIFDEDRITGSGAWAKSFLEITKKNDWVVLSATPGDCWSDYITIFIANGFYRSKTEFNNRHVVFSRFTKYPKVDRYVETKHLEKLRSEILVNMDFNRPAANHHQDIYCEYSIIIYKDMMKNRISPKTHEPMQGAAELCYELRKIVNSDESRADQVLEIVKNHPKVIIFYSFDYELNILKSIMYPNGTIVAEWNGHEHQEIPKNDKWVYLVNYSAGAEGWNCIETDTMIFYSQNYSYKVLTQSCGRIDRMNTPYKDLYYYHLKSHSSIDLAISRALSAKKQFNENSFATSFVRQNNVPRRVATYESSSSYVTNKNAA